MKFDHNIHVEAKDIIREYVGGLVQSSYYEPESNEELWVHMGAGCGAILADYFMEGVYTPMEYNAIRNEVARILDGIFEPICDEGRPISNPRREINIFRREMKSIDRMEVLMAQDKRSEEISHGRCVTESMFAVLLDMARENKCPDGTFSDAECVLWSTFRDALRKGNH